MWSRAGWLFSATVALMVFVGQPLHAQFASEAKPVPAPPSFLKDVGIDQKLNQQVPLDLPFVDEAGNPVKLGDYFDQKNHKPVVLALVYYKCPALCTMTLNSLTSNLKIVPFDAGDKFNVVTISFDPREKAPLAAAKKQEYVKSYGRPDAGRGWHFLTGEESSIKALATAAGFRYYYDPKLDQYVHASGVMVLTPEGKLSRYFYGVDYTGKDMRLGLVDASEGKIGSLTDEILLYCYHYDPVEGKYTPFVVNLMRAAGAVTVVALGSFITLMFRRERRMAIPVPPAKGADR